MRAPDLDAPTLPRFGRRPAVPSGRSLVGGLLVAAAALGTVAAASGDAEPPPPARVVAAREVAAGERLTAADLRTAPVGLVGHDASLFTSPGQLEGAVALAPLHEGDVVQASAVLPAGEAPRAAAQLTVQVSSTGALSGRLVPGERVDVLATFGSGVDARTEQVAAGVQVVHVDASDDLASVGQLALTVAVDDPAAVVPLAHAATAATVTVVRPNGLALVDDDALGRDDQGGGS